MQHRPGYCQQPMLQTKLSPEHTAAFDRICEARSQSRWTTLRQIVAEHLSRVEHSAEAGARP
jgi:hypothetical protein